VATGSDLPERMAQARIGARRAIKSEGQERDVCGQHRQHRL